MFWQHFFHNTSHSARLTIFSTSLKAELTSGTNNLSQLILTLKKVTQTCVQFSTLVYVFCMYYIKNENRVFF